MSIPVKRHPDVSFVRAVSRSEFTKWKTDGGLVSIPVKHHPDVSFVRAVSRSEFTKWKKMENRWWIGVHPSKASPRCVLC